MNKKPREGFHENIVSELKDLYQVNKSTRKFTRTIAIDLHIGGWKGIEASSMNRYFLKRFLNILNKHTY